MLEPFAAHDISPGWSCLITWVLAFVSWAHRDLFPAPTESGSICCRLKVWRLFELKSLTNMFSCVASSSGAAYALECAGLWNFNACFQLLRKKYCPTHLPSHTEETGRWMSTVDWRCYPPPGLIFIASRHWALLDGTGGRSVWVTYVPSCLNLRTCNGKQNHTALFGPQSAIVRVLPLLQMTTGTDTFLPFTWLAYWNSKLVLAAPFLAICFYSIYTVRLCWTVLL